MASTPEGPRHATITPDDHGALLAMTTWFLMVTMILATSTRIIVRYTTQHVPGFDDILVLVATAFGIGSAIAISLAVNKGLGRRISSLGQTEIDTLQKEVYAATILYVLTVAVSKLSIMIFFTRLAVAQTHKTIVLILTAVIGSWSIAAVFGVAFQCPTPTPWNVFSGQCVSLLSFWIGISVVDIITDVVMIALPVNIVWSLQMSPGKKIIVIFVFSVRLIVIITSIIRLVYLSRIISSSDPSFDSIPYGIVTQCHSTLSVIVACSPSLKPFMDHAKSGMLNISLWQHTAGTTYAKDSYNMQALSKNSRQGSKGGSNSSPDNTANHSQIGNNIGSGRTRRNIPIQVARPDPLGSQTVLRPDNISHTVNVRSGKGPDATPDLLRGEDRVSEDSGDSKRRIIKQTKAWDVRFDDYHHLKEGRASQPEGYMTSWDEMGSERQASSSGSRGASSGSRGARPGTRE
ncbi:hypothetical protein K432DRAFT_410102 [Lepidopterella palustris CBS 459.81]|uniref:Rhodopsin domain-containing protein n=1 Tax=Lepidopterella palustris CBS 459.81 TaxID=1314670 RepID=A0A8E2DYT0_9PEZI|nr:hypothetical protein K432DRAFT_410102 [Lepidopterella palustris CBS 459.81]